MLHKTEQEIDKMLTDLASLCQSSRDAEKVAGMLVRQHRTHQQGIGRFIQESVKYFADAKDNGRFDLRNAATCEMCKEVSEAIDQHGLPLV